MIVNENLVEIKIRQPQENEYGDASQVFCIQPARICDAKRNIPTQDDELSRTSETFCAGGPRDKKAAWANRCKPEPDDTAQSRDEDAVTHSHHAVRIGANGQNKMTTSSSRKPSSFGFLMNSPMSGHDRLSQCQNDRGKNKGRSGETTPRLRGKSPRRVVEGRTRSLRARQAR
jgi:hypothetical protein